MKHPRQSNTKTLFSLILFAVSINSFAITNNGSRITDTIPGRSLASQQYLPQYTSHADAVRDSIIENRLVALALKQPQYEQGSHQQKILEYQLKKQRNNWLNLLSFSANYNDQTFQKSQVGAPTYVYPKYFFGITIPFGLIFANGSDMHITKESALIAKAQQKELEKTIKEDVLSAYKQYKAYEKLLAIQNQAVDDEQAGYIQTEQKFREGTATLELYNESAKKYNEEVVKAINLQLQQDLIKLEIERLIGTKLESVLK